MKLTKTFILGVLATGSVALLDNIPTAALAASSTLTCMEPKILDADPKAAFDALPKVYSAPSEGSSIVAATSAVVFVSSPAEESAGFTKVIRLNGKPGWVMSNQIIPWHNENVANATCIGELRPNGTPHAIYKH